MFKYAMPKTEARWKHETSMWSKLAYIDRNVQWFESQEIPPFRFKTSGNNFDDQKLRASWAGRKLTWWIKHRDDLHISNLTAVLEKKMVLPGPNQNYFGKINSLMARFHFSKLNSWPSLKCSQELILNPQLWLWRGLIIWLGLLTQIRATGR